MEKISHLAKTYTVIAIVIFFLNNKGYRVPIYWRIQWKVLLWFKLERLLKVSQIDKKRRLYSSYSIGTMSCWLIRKCTIKILLAVQLQVWSRYLRHICTISLSSQKGWNKFLKISIPWNTLQDIHPRVHKIRSTFE